MVPDTFVPLHEICELKLEVMPVQAVNCNVHCMESREALATPAALLQQICIITTCYSMWIMAV